MSRIALFIDAAYLRYLLKEMPSDAAVDLRALIEKIRDGRDLLRTYYYDCLPWRADTPTMEQRARFAKQQKFYDGLVRRIPRFQLRLGKLARRHEDGRFWYEQKQVDILLSVDLVQLASRYRITDAAILAGDSDFLPAIELAKQEGVVMHLYHGRNPHRDLVACCDERVEIDMAFIESVRK
jgi:Uncharacterized conserved protein